MKKTASVWATRVQDVKILRGHLKPVEEVNLNKFSIFQDLENLDKGRQPLAPISQNLEDSTCSFTSVNTSLHQSDFVLLTNEVQSKEYLKIQVNSIALKIWWYTILSLIYFRNWVLWLLMNLLMRKTRSTPLWLNIMSILSQHCQRSILLTFTSIWEIVRWAKKWHWMMLE